MSEKKGLLYRLDKSSLLTVIGIIFLFSFAILATLVAPQMIETAWTQPASPYQKQMHEVADTHLYISNQGTTDARDLQLVYHLRDGFSLLAFSESEGTRIIAPKDLEKYITRFGDEELKLTSDLLLLRAPQKGEGGGFDGAAQAETLRSQLQAGQRGDSRLDFRILELFRPEKSEAFSVSRSDGVIEDWVDENYVILDPEVRQEWHDDPGVVYISNPEEYRVKSFKFGMSEGWRYDPDGDAIADLEELKSKRYGFLSRKELIDLGEDIYRAEGCWYCHTLQTRTLVQDVVLNGSDSEPAPPSTPGEYVYDNVSFPGTRRIGPDLSRVGVKRPSRDWHKSHFWSPKTESPGSIMPKFQHFFDDDPRGTSRSPFGVPNYKFEAIFQYLMTKGTRITAPTRAWWLGKDPIDTKAIIEGRLDPKEIR